MNGSGAITITFNNNDFNNNGDYPKGDYSTIVRWKTPDLGTDYFVSSSTRTNLIYGSYLVEYNMGYPGNTEVTDYQPISITVSSGITASIVNVKGSTCGLSTGAVTGTSTSIYQNSVYNLFDSNNSLIQQNNIKGQYGYFDGLSAGTYYIMVNDNSGSSARTETFIINDSKTFDYGLYVIPNSNCGGLNSGVIMITGLTGTPPYTYLWNNFSISDKLTGLTNGVYSVTVTDSNGCSLSKSAYIDTITPLGVQNVITSSPTCLKSNGSIELTISGGAEPYYYSVSNGFSTISYSKTLSLNDLGYGTYKIVVTDSALCRIEKSVELFTENGGISEVSINSKNSTCSSQNGSIEIGIKSGLPPFTYSLTNSIGDITSKISYQSQYLFDNLGSDTYTISVGDSGECYHSQSVTITSEDKFTISVSTTGTTFQQSNGVISVELSSGGVGPYTYTLDNIVKISKTYSLNAIINYVSSGLHTLLVTDSTGCVQNKQIFVPILEPVNFFLYGEDATEGNNGKINVLISSGIPPFKFYWSENVPDNPQKINIDNLSADTYSLRIIDSNGTALSRKIDIQGNNLFTSYETYEMGSEMFNVEIGTKYGLQQLLLEGYNDLISEILNFLIIFIIKKPD